MYIGNKLRLHPKSFHHRIRDGYGHYFDNDQFLAIDPFDRSKFHDIYRPPANLQEKDDNFILELMLPGFTKEDISIVTEGNRLIITGKKEISEEDKGSYIRREHHVLEFEREFMVDESTDLANIDAEFENGVLRLELTKQKLLGNKKEIAIH